MVIQMTFLEDGYFSKVTISIMHNIIYIESVTDIRRVDNIIVY